MYSKNPVHNKLIEIYHTRISEAKPHKLKNALPWQAQWVIALNHLKKPVCKWLYVGDYKADENPSILNLRFIDEKEAQEFCDDMNEARENWAYQERKDYNSPINKWKRTEANQFAAHALYKQQNNLP